MNTPVRLIAVVMLGSTLSCRGAESSTSFSAGNCAFRLPRSSDWQVRAEYPEHAALSFRFRAPSGLVVANIDISCSDLGYDAYVAGSFEKAAFGLRYLGGAGDSRTIPISGPNWQGLETRYFQGQPCLHVVGPANPQHAFVLELCGSPEAMDRQTPVIHDLLGHLRVRAPPNQP